MFRKILRAYKIIVSLDNGIVDGNDFIFLILLIFLFNTSNNYELVNKIKNKSKVL